LAQRIAGGDRRSCRNSQVFGHVFRHRMADHKLCGSVQVSTYFRMHHIIAGLFVGCPRFFLLLCLLGMWSLSGGRTRVFIISARGSLNRPHCTTTVQNICNLFSSISASIYNSHNNNNNMLITRTHWDKRYCISEKEVR